MTALQLSVQGVLAGTLSGRLPELYDLRDVVENDEGSHLADTAFDHSIRVAQIMCWLLDNSRASLREYFARNIGDRSRRELLETAALLHDIGKKSCYRREGEYSRCSGHEEVGARMASAVLERFGFRRDESAYITTVIRRHDDVFQLFEPDGSLREGALERFNSGSPDFCRELVFHMLADVLGSQLRYHDPERFARILEILREQIRRWEDE